jgi:hypothetical protein
LSKHSRARIACGRTSRTTTAGIYLDQGEGERAINVIEVSPVENIEDLPAELNASTLADLEVLEHGNVIVKDRRNSYRVAWHVSDLTQARRIRKASDVYHIR